MKSFLELQKNNPNLAATLLTCTREELLNLYAIEVEEKEELEKYKEDQEFYKTELESIINWGMRWLKNNKKNKHHIYIDKDTAKLIYTNTETEFI